MLLIATIISDSLPESWALLRGAWGPVSQNTKKLRAQEEEKEQGHKEEKGTPKDWVSDGEKKNGERGKETWWRCNASRGAMQHSARKGL